jgi:hypothetical protein
MQLLAWIGEPPSSLFFVGNMSQSKPTISEECKLELGVKFLRTIICSS